MTPKNGYSLPAYPPPSVDPPPSYRPAKPVSNTVRRTNPQRPLNGVHVSQQAGSAQEGVPKPKKSRRTTKEPDVEAQPPSASAASRVPSPWETNYMIEQAEKRIGKMKKPRIRAHPRNIRANRFINTLDGILIGTFIALVGAHVQWFFRSSKKDLCHTAAGGFGMILISTFTLVLAWIVWAFVSCWKLDQMTVRIREAVSGGEEVKRLNKKRMMRMETMNLLAIFGLVYVFMGTLVKCLTLTGPENKTQQHR